MAERSSIKPKFAGMHNLNIHMASIHKERKLIQCPNIKLVCHKISTRTVHEKQKPNKCEICKKCFKKRGQDAFQVHLLWIYFLSKTAYERTCWKSSWREKPFLCSICEKKPQKSDLTDWSHFHISWRKRSIQSAIFVTILLNKKWLRTH